MIKSLPVRWYLLKIIVSLISFLLALFFEDASRQRSVILIVLFALFIIWDYVRPTLKNRWPLFLLDGTIIFLMEYYSKFLVNYFFHLFYLGIILEAGFVFERWQANTVSAIIFDISDNGTGGEYKEGFGLENMKQRVEAIGGKLEVSGGEKFTIHGGFPVGRVV
jgi:predicted small integral membrane protein